MERYHINSRGNPGVCKATKYCPFGGADQHYATPDAARCAYETMMEKFYPLTLEMISQMVEIAEDNHPDNPEIGVDEGEWCYSAVPEVSSYLTDHKVVHQVHMPPTRFETEDGSVPHAWITLENGTLIDPTVSQFMDYGIDSWPHPQGIPDIAVIGPDDKFQSHYIGATDG